MANPLFFTVRHLGHHSGHCSDELIPAGGDGLEPCFCGLGGCVAEVSCKAVGALFELVVHSKSTPAETATTTDTLEVSASRVHQIPRNLMGCQTRKV